MTRSAALPLSPGRHPPARPADRPAGRRRLRRMAHAIRRERARRQLDAARRRICAGTSGWPHARSTAGPTLRARGRAGPLPLGRA